MGEREYMDLLELQTRIKESIDDAFPERYWVKAEIASWSPRANGHCYLSLTQSRGGKSVAESRAMIWKWQYPLLSALFEQTTGEPLRAGITVLVQVQVNYSASGPSRNLHRPAIWRCRRSWRCRNCLTGWR